MADLGPGGPGPGFGGPGAVPPPGIGFGFPGLGGGAGFNLGLDAGLGGGLGGGLFGPLGGGGFGGPGIGGIGVPWTPYIPVTPLGALGGVKGDLIIPIVAIGVALFILLIIFLAVKAALAWKIDLIGSAIDAKRSRREVIATPPVQDEAHMTQLASIVMNALDSQNCLDKIICSVGTYGKGASWPTYFEMMNSLISDDYKHSLTLLKSCADGSVTADKFKCGSSDSNDNQKQPSPSPLGNQNQIKPDAAATPQGSSSNSAKQQQKPSPSNANEPVHNNFI